MSNWAEEKAREINARREKEETTNAALLERRKLIDEQGPGLWRELRQHLIACVSDLNEALGKDALVIVGKEPNQMDVRFTVKHPSPQLLIRFEPTTAQDAFHWAYPGSRIDGGKCRLTVDPSGVLSFWSGQYSSTPESLSKHMMDGLLREG